jgi:capsular polysaccharide transport system permease protein
MASLENAKNEARRKALYLERIVQPNTPDIPLEPHRLKSILAAIFMGLISCGILSILISGIREHND